MAGSCEDGNEPPGSLKPVKFEFDYVYKDIGVVLSGYKFRLELELILDCNLRLSRAGKSFNSVSLEVFNMAGALDAELLYLDYLENDIHEYINRADDFNDLTEQKFLQRILDSHFERGTDVKSVWELGS
ncbi:hypothetical protein ANN_09406 [Periplaneta americana]|uniref:Uncharacterized protein n=1 Tax=Periplaneta americana TaxID=6978 RepID=A0ABQ8TLB0_PERAM|nr:hypothetical protein ANN_09406 [Periplaneta americana]